jgi:hypothetical protein
MLARMPDMKMKIMVVSLLRQERSKIANSQTIVSVGLVYESP